MRYELPNLLKVNNSYQWCFAYLRTMSFKIQNLEHICISTTHTGLNQTSPQTSTQRNLTKEKIEEKRFFFSHFEHREIETFF